MTDQPIVVVGNLGWGNGDRRGGASAFDVYGPGGRWGKRPSRPGTSAYPEATATRGDHLADALVEAGATEGDRLVVVVLPRFTDPGDLATWTRGITEYVRSAVPGAAAAPLIGLVDLPIDCAACGQPGDGYECYQLTHPSAPGQTFYVHPDCAKSPEGKAALAELAYRLGSPQ